MKKYMFCLIAVAAITILLIPYGKAYAFGCINFDDFDEGYLDETKWTVENFGGCYEEPQIVGGKLLVKKKGSGDCNGRIFFIPNTSKQVKSISAEVTVIESTNCQRARLLADPVILRHGESGFYQLSLMENCPFCGEGWLDEPAFARFHIYTDPSGSDYLRLFDGIFNRNAFFPEGYDEIINKTYKLYLRVSGNEIISRIMDESGELLGTIRYTPPGGLKLRGDHVLGLSCYGRTVGGGEGEFLFDNVRVCFW